MSLTERTSVSGTALSFLLKECISSSCRQEGFLFGNITENVTNHISDSRTNNARVEVLINVTSMLPVPETGMFYSPAGVLNEDVLADILDDVSGNVVGWYHFRQNNSLKPSLRDKLISKSLHQYFLKYNVRYFLYCSVTSKQSLSNSTHTYSYRFYKASKRNELEPLIDITNNLGENVSGYKRTYTGDKNDEFNKAVIEATKNGSCGIAEAVRETLEKAVSDAAHWEVKSRELASDINCMLAMLANHYQAKQSTICKNIVKEEEQQIIKPLVEVIAASTTKRPEPFDFVNDIIKNNLKPNTSECSRPTNNVGNEIYSMGDSNVEVGSSFSSGQKRLHPEGHSHADLDKTKLNNHSPSWDVVPSLSSPSTSSDNPHQHISDA